MDVNFNQLSLIDNDSWSWYLPIHTNGISIRFAIHKLWIGATFRSKVFGALSAGILFKWSCYAVIFNVVYHTFRTTNKYAVTFFHWEFCVACEGHYLVDLKVNDADFRTSIALADGCAVSTARHVT